MYEKAGSLTLCDVLPDLVFFFHSRAGETPQSSEDHLQTTLYTLLDNSENQVESGDTGAVMLKCTLSQPIIYRLCPMKKQPSQIELFI